MKTFSGWLNPLVFHNGTSVWTIAPNFHPFIPDNVNHTHEKYYNNCHGELLSKVLGTQAKW